MAERELLESAVAPDPFTQFDDWFADATEHGAAQPESMIVATATPDGRPSARAVLLRGVDARGLCFFTNLESPKAVEISANPRAAIVFHWPEVQRQVRVTGAVEAITRDEVDDYWRGRPRASRISAWSSDQSAVAGSREEVEDRRDEVAARFSAGGVEQDVPLPGFWGGFRVVPDHFEFWQHRDDRLHDRLRYSRAPSGAWRLERLQP